MRTLLAVGAILTVLAAGVPASGTSPPSAAARMKEIVHAWSNRLNAGDNDGAARLFRLPAVVVQSETYRFRTHKQLTRWHSLLPCSGHLTSIVVKGRFATAAFVLDDRLDAPCASRGGVAAARFEIVRGKIVTWIQVPVSQPPRVT